MKNDAAGRLRELADKIESGKKVVTSEKYEAEVAEKDPCNGFRAYECTGKICYFLTLDDKEG